MSLADYHAARELSDVPSAMLVMEAMRRPPDVYISYSLKIFYPEFMDMKMRVIRMSFYDYEQSKDLTMVPFYALIMAAMKDADDGNLSRLKMIFPEVWEESYARNNAPGGLLSDERIDEE